MIWRLPCFSMKQCTHFNGQSLWFMYTYTYTHNDRRWYTYGCICDVLKMLYGLSINGEGNVWCKGTHREHTLYVDMYKMYV